MHPGSARDGTELLYDSESVRAPFLGTRHRTWPRTFHITHSYTNAFLDLKIRTAQNTVWRIPARFLVWGAAALAGSRRGSRLRSPRVQGRSTFSPLCRPAQGQHTEPEPPKRDPDLCPAGGETPQSPGFLLNPRFTLPFRQKHLYS